jgi:carbon monoxide dehydrogenase subunit G
MISLMPTAERTVEISASPETVWSIITDPSMVPKMFPDVVSCVSDPPMPAPPAVGNKLIMTAKIAGRRVQQSLELTEVIQNKKVSTRQLPGGLFKTYASSFSLEPSKKGTRTTESAEFEVSAGYLGKVLSTLVVNRTVRKNILVSLTNLKELAELKELPTGTSG